MNDIDNGNVEGVQEGHEASLPEISNLEADIDDQLGKKFGEGIKCAHKKCKSPSEEYVSCKHCDKNVHPTCYNTYVLLSGIEQLIDPVNGTVYIVCSKTCHGKVMKSHIKMQGKRIPWNKDGKNGTDDPNTSEKILLDWLLTEGNYNKWRGKNNRGTTKEAYCHHIKKLMDDAGVREERSIKTIDAKIREWEKAHAKVIDWLNVTGSGVEDGDSKQRYIARMFPHYELLKGIFGDRARSRPKVTTETMDTYAELGEDESRSEVNTTISASETNGIGTHATPVVDRVPASAQTKRSSSSGTKTTSSAKKPKSTSTTESMLEKIHKGMERSRAISDVQGMLALKDDLEKRGFNKKGILRIAPFLKEYYDAAEEKEEEEKYIDIHSRNSDSDSDD